MSLKTILVCCFFLQAQAVTQPFTIMLDPAGDAQNAGRKIEDYVERGITLQCAEQLKKALESTCSGIRVILTRFPGETIQPLQNASFANRLKVDLYVSIHFFAQPKGTPTVHLFFFCTNPTTDYWKTSLPSLSFVPAHKVHLNSIATSKDWAETCYKKLEQYKQHFICTAPLGIPFKPLRGIQAPALGIEASLRAPSDWQQYIKPFTEGIAALVDSGKKTRRSRGFFS